jgi:hypothetical protein
MKTFGNRSGFVSIVGAHLRLVKYSTGMFRSSCGTLKEFLFAKTRMLSLHPRAEQPTGISEFGIRFPKL